ncbi:MAG: hypothetical protein OXC64_04275 [Flavobacteriaceae bacterium]|nr:hypothetical protein [Flavobacteriaceae bacterium]
MGLNKNQLSLTELLESLIEMTFHSEFKSMHEKQINQMVQQNLLKHLMKLGSDSGVYGQVNAIVYDHLKALNQQLEKDNVIEYSNYYSHSIEYYFKHLQVVTESKSQRIPDGSPIGTIYCDHEIW